MRDIDLEIYKSYMHDGASRRNVGEDMGAARTAPTTHVKTVQYIGFDDRKTIPGNVLPHPATQRFIRSFLADQNRMISLHPDMRSWMDSGEYL